MRIDCDDCAMHHTEQCADCLVTVLLRPQARAVEIDDDLGGPLSVLAEAGLVPVLKFRPRRGRDPDAGGAAAV